MSKQETLSVDEIRRLCTISDYLDESDIHSGDKTVSFDGNIIYYRNKKPKASGNEFLIPIQIKGKEYKKLPSKDRLSYPVSTRDMSNFLENGGIIYFVVAIEKQTNLLKTYAKILLPIDIRELMDRKSNQKTISITLHTVIDSDSLVSLCDLFAKNKLKQSLVVLNSDNLNFSMINEFSFSTIPGSYTDPAEMLVKNPIKYLYAKQNGIEIPISASKITISRNGDIDIAVNGKSYNFPTTHTVTKTLTSFIINEVIKIDYKETKQLWTFSLVDVSKVIFKKVYSTFLFISDLCKSNDILVNNSPILNNAKNPFREKVSKDFISLLENTIKIGNDLKNLNIPLDSLTTQDVSDSLRTIKYLKTTLIEKKPIRNNFDTDVGLCILSLGEKKILLEYEKIENEMFLLRDYLRNGQRVAIFCENENSTHKINNWFVVNSFPEDITNIIFDKKQMIADLSNIETESDFNYLNQLILLLLNSYDLKNQQNILDFISELNSILLKKDSCSEINIINSLQIEYRKQNLSSAQKKDLLLLKTNSSSELIVCCACILLEQYEEFEIYFQKISPSEQIEFKKWPIFNLLPN